MSSDLLLGAVIGGVVVLVLLKKNAAVAATVSSGAKTATIYEAGDIAGSLGGGCGCGAALCDVLTRY